MKTDFQEQKMNHYFYTLAVACLAAISGCSFEPTRYAISGVVKINGNLGALAVVAFTPVNGVSETNKGGSVTTDGKGEFKLGEQDKNLGLLPGEYKVSFSQMTINGRPAMGGGGSKKSEQVAGEKEAVPTEFRSPTTTPVTMKVEKSGQTFDFDVKK